MAHSDGDWLDAQYNPLRNLPDPGALFAAWEQRSAEARRNHSCHLDLRYGPSPGERLDVFPALRADAPVAVFIHGGFWRGSDKSLHAFLAPALTATGAAVVLLNYDLCPQVRIEDIVSQVHRGVAWVAQNIRRFGGDPQRIGLVGHSAGAHLAAVLLSEDGAGAPAPSVRQALCISGLFDLEVIRQVPFLQADLQLSEESARRLSPIRRRPSPGAQVHAVVGGEESAEFLRQTTLLRAHWGTDCTPVCEPVPGCGHFDILEALALPHSALHALAARVIHGHAVTAPARSPPS
ncbi:alpha/beta hydrolase [Xenophilus sp.]|uniref:alpha/beta hydrolase n=1 Tax=Xenophilus sp. TaxID=1873499 RepID=UPI0037DC0F88